METASGLPKERSGYQIPNPNSSDKPSNELCYRNREAVSNVPQRHSSTSFDRVSERKPQTQELTSRPKDLVRSVNEKATGPPSSDDIPFSIGQDVTVDLSEASDSDLDDDYVRCICGVTEDDPFHAMICCDDCTAWQHNVCMGLSEIEEDLPQQYYCEMCRPQNHRSTLQALRRGERIWKIRFEETWESKVTTAFREKIQA